MKKVFLGGTCNNSSWRDELTPLLDIDYFDPVVEDWNEAAQAQEIAEREACDFCLYVLTPKMHGSYAIAELVDDANKRPKKTVFCVLQRDGDQSFDDRQMKSWKQVALLVMNNGARSFDSLEDVAAHLNQSR